MTCLECNLLGSPTLINCTGAALHALETQVPGRDEDLMHGAEEAASYAAAQHARQRRQRLARDTECDVDQAKASRAFRGPRPCREPGAADCSPVVVEVVADGQAVRVATAEVRGAAVDGRPEERAARGGVHRVVNSCLRRAFLGLRHLPPLVQPVALRPRDASSDALARSRGAGIQCLE